jgi:Repeat of unknown function (DUF5648)
MKNWIREIEIKQTRQFIFALVFSASLGLISACGSSDRVVVEQTKSVTLDVASTAADDMKVSPLLKSLRALYPDGVLPANTSELAAFQRLQSVNKTQIVENSASASILANVLAAAVSSQNGAQSEPVIRSKPALASDFRAISRVQNTSLYGAYFFTIYPTERSAALAGNPNWAYEGPAFSASLVSDVDLFPVHRFRNLQNGSYLYTIYEGERSSIAANYASTFTYEGVAWYARQSAATGWKPLYRFRNVTNGTYLFSAYESEKNAIIANYPTVFELEGVAYYVKEPDAVDKYVGTWLTCAATGNASAPYMKFSITLNKTTPISLNGQAQIWSTYRDSGCSNIISAQQAIYPYYANLVGSKTIAGKTVDLMDTGLNGSLIKDTYFVIGRDLYLGGGAADAQGYPTVLVTPSYYLQ